MYVFKEFIRIFLMKKKNLKTVHIYLWPLVATIQSHLLSCINTSSLRVIMQKIKKGSKYFFSSKVSVSNNNTSGKRRKKTLLHQQIKAFTQSRWLHPPPLLGPSWPSWPS